MRKAAVVGAGVVGLCCAFHLRRRGWNVVVLERGVRDGACSAGNAGWIVPSCSAPLPRPTLFRDLAGWLTGRTASPFRVDGRSLPSLAGWLWRFARRCGPRDFHRGLEALTRLSRGTMAAFDGLAADGVDFEMHRDGVLFAFRSRKKLERTFRDAARMGEFGLGEAERLDGSEIGELEPGLSPDLAGGYVFRGERHVRPESLLRGLTARLRETGVEVRHGAPMRDAVVADGAVRTLKLETGELEADAFVLAAGAWAGGLAGSFGTRLPVAAGRGYSVTWRSNGTGGGVGTDVAADDGGEGTLVSRPVMLGEARVACSPYRAGFRLSGFLELTRTGPPEEDSPAGRRIPGQEEAEARVRRLVRSAGPYFREAAALPRGEDGTAWWGLRPLTPDGLPVIGRLPGLDNGYVATGHGMLGLTLGPVTGRAVARLVDGGEPGEEMVPFGPGRFRR